MITVYDENGDEMSLPLKWEICSTCNGNGRESAYLGAFTRDDMDAEGPEFFEEYMAGAYDRTCEVCRGSGKVQVVDYDRLTDAEKAAYDDACEEERSYRAMQEAERRMGA